MQHDGLMAIAPDGHAGYCCVEDPGPGWQRPSILVYPHKIRCECGLAGIDFGCWLVSPWLRDTETERDTYIGAAPPVHLHVFFSSSAAVNQHRWERWYFREPASKLLHSHKIEGKCVSAL